MFSSVFFASSYICCCSISLYCREFPAGFLRKGAGGGARKASRSSSSLQGEREFAFIIDFIILFTLIMQEPTGICNKVWVRYIFNWR